MNPLIADLIKLALTSGADALQAVAVLRKHGVDEAEYRKVIDDHRTFKDFHGKNPRTEPDTNIPPKPPTVPPVAEPQPPPVIDPTAARYATMGEAEAVRMVSGPPVSEYGIYKTPGGEFFLWPNDGPVPAPGELVGLPQVPPAIPPPVEPPITPPPPPTVEVPAPQPNPSPTPTPEPTDPTSKRYKTLVDAREARATSTGESHDYAIYQADNGTFFLWPHGIGYAPGTLVEN